MTRKMMLAKCKNTDPLGWMVEGDLYEVQRIGDKWIIADGLVVSDEIFQESFEFVDDKKL